MQSESKSRSTGLNRVLEIIIVAVLYAMAGRVGQYAAIPPGNVTPIWPSSGIALAAVLLRGSSIWPAILLGSLLVNLWVFLTQVHTSMLIRVVTSTGMGIGATLGALSGAALFRRYVAPGRYFERARDVAIFVLLSGILSGL